jgi:hypothetical protein
MHLNKLSRLAITLSLGTVVQVVSTPKIVQAQVKLCVLKLAEQPNPPTSGQENPLASGQENPPVTDRPEGRVATSTYQRQEPSNIERPSVDPGSALFTAGGAIVAGSGDIRLDTTGTTDFPLTHYPPTSGQENPPVTDKSEKRVPASTHQQQDPSHIERSSVNGDNTILITTGNLISSPNSARSSAEGSIHLVNGNIHIDHLAPVDIVDVATESCHLRKSAVGASQKR